MTADDMRTLRGVCEAAAAEHAGAANPPIIRLPVSAVLHLLNLAEKEARP